MTTPQGRDPGHDAPDHGPHGGAPGQDGAAAAPGPVVVDARGLRCPLPVIRLAAAARDRTAGSRLTVWSTDPAARLDVPAWARMRGHTVVAESPLPPSADATAPGEGDEPAWAITVELGA